MMNAIAKFWSVFATLFSTINEFAEAAEKVGKVTNRAAEDFYDQQTLEGAARTMELKSKLAELEAITSPKSIDV